MQRGRVLPVTDNGGDPRNAEIKAFVDVPESVTSQSRHSLLLQGLPPSRKLLIPLNRRDVRVVEGARFESVRPDISPAQEPELQSQLRRRSESR